MKSSSKYSNIVIFGTAGLSELVTAFLEKESQYRIAGYCIESEFMDDSDTFQGRPVVGFELLEERYPPNEYKLFIAVGNNYVRQRIFKESKRKGFSMISHVTESVTHWNDLEYGENVLISGISSLQPFVTVGHNTLIIGSKIGHHSKIGNHVLLSCSTIGGNVTIGDFSFLGMNSAIKQHTVIGEKNIIGMGCNIESNTNTNEVYTSNNSTRKRTVTADKIRDKYL